MVGAPPLARAQGGPAFGDSGWVAPLPAGAIEGEPTDPGPRVAGKDVEPVGETILRTPFRIAFLPLRIVGMGIEGIAGVVGSKVVKGNSVVQERPAFQVGPTVSYTGSGGPALGLRVSAVVDPARDAKWSVGGSWSLNDTRRVSADFRRGAIWDPWGLQIRTTYDFRPNVRYYGIGNESSEDDKSIWLGETGAVDAAVRFGSLDQELRLLAGWRSTSARRGWNDSPGLLDRFTLAETPGMLDASKVVSFGVGGNLALVDDLRDPTAGVHARAEARQFHGGDDVDFRRFHLEGRAYDPVFSDRRVIALRALHQSVHRVGDSGVVPFYYLPETVDGARFAGYAAHRFRDRHLGVLHAEYRWLIWERLWALGLAELGQVATEAKAFRIRDAHESYGGGLRFAFGSTSVARLQVAKGNEGLTAYVIFKEDF
jgi:hypothetical protein